jgi:serine protease Do
VELESPYLERIVSAYNQQRTGPRLVIFLLLSISLYSPALTAQSKPDDRSSIAATSHVLEQLSTKLAPSVVEIDVKAWEIADEKESPDRAGYLAHDERIGTGVLLTENGEVLTNHHIIRGAQRITVHLLRSNSSVSARVIGDDPEADLALLKIEGSGLSHFDLRSGGKVTQGQIVLALGSPFGFGHSVSLGIVSSPSRMLDDGAPTSYIQTDAPINPGNSGGPLVDLDGHLVGINTLLFSHSGGSEGVGFAIPIETLRQSVAAMEACGSVERPYLGLYLQPVSEALAHGLQLAGDSGLLVDDVEQYSPASAAGLEPGDVILRANGREIPDLKAFQEVLNSLHVDQSILFEIEHKRLRVSLNVKPVFGRAHHLDLLDYVDFAKDCVPPLGIVALNLDSKLRHLVPEARLPDGVVVAAKYDGVAYDTDDLEAGDILHEINNHSIRNVSALSEYLQKVGKHESLILQIERKGHLLYIAVPPEG